MNDEMWDSMEEYYQEKAEDTRIRAECRRTCEGGCYRCLEHAYLGLIEDLLLGAWNEWGIKPRLALKLAALVYKSVFEGLIDEVSYEPNEVEKKALDALKEVIEV